MRTINRWAAHPPPLETALGEHLMINFLSEIRKHGRFMKKKKKKEDETHHIHHSLCVICPVPKRIKQDCVQISSSQWIISPWPWRRRGRRHTKPVSCLESSEWWDQLWRQLSQYKLGGMSAYFAWQVYMGLISAPQPAVPAEVSHSPDTEVAQNKGVFPLWSESTQVPH